MGSRVDREPPKNFQRYTGIPMHRIDTFNIGDRVQVFPATTSENRTSSFQATIVGMRENPNQPKNTAVFVSSRLGLGLGNQPAERISLGGGTAASKVM